ncbi:lysine N(6)-hydroxylase/L-ornithine N(5)-oxygenase family protein [Couchioplanes azureus]|uniref:lysine N(6)-hydroxylase/L-ornithine N(5)-oxygenase family protein n=1 Tax=Couchioplanes caeruleus TaxID=56438 RepID=UPI00166F7B12|nr:SidA/IucD/PvdA family monooxygenase [Couchioplanes caeruleus]GGQ63096.1 lysine/ornithine N-monooxygenase [Couchioplanes caeruleus subsp. azureus]
MSHDLAGDDLPVFDLVGIGFGPSNLAMAIALTEYNATAGMERAVTAHFLERQPRFGWHRGMLIEDATMQVSFLKDLVTLRNPASEFSFLCYLQSKDRLVDFINHKSLFPLRVEFHDYFEWAAAKVDDLVTYGHEVVEVRPVVRDGAIVYLDVTARQTGSGETVSYRARNVLVATGLLPHLPEGVSASARVWHNRDLLFRAAELPVDAPARFVVVGAGQSAAETVAHLHDRFPQAEVCAVFARYGYSPADDSPFANRIFDPAAVDDYFAAPSEIKQRLMAYHGNTNYAVVDMDLIEDLYARLYREKVLGAERLRIFNTARLAQLSETPTGVRTVVESLVTGEQTELDADAVVFATGYRAADPLRLLPGVEPYCHRDAQGRPRIGRDYRVTTSPELRCGVYLQGATEHTHGITSSLLSNTALRVGEILQSVIDKGRPDVAAHAAVEEVSAAR